MNTDSLMNRDALSLAGKTIGLSISESEDLEALGMSKAVLDLAYVEIARHLLAHGAHLAYGGDQRQAGYTQQLFDLVRAYDLPGMDVSDRIVNYLAWPLHLNVTDQHRIELLDVATLEELPLDDGLREEFGIDDKKFLIPDATENRYIWTRCLTDMRQRMNDDIDARIILGGQSSGFLGRYPGIAEEASMALPTATSEGKPIYLLGGFGGCSRDLVKAIEGAPPTRLTLDFQRHESEHAAAYSELYEYYNERHPDAPISYDALIAAFHDGGIRALNNRLSTEENRRLFHTDDIDEMIAMILKGLRHSG
jgi:hypothetical protein